MDPRRIRAYRVGTSLSAAASGLFTWILWYFPLALLFQLSPPLAMAGMVALAALFVRVYALPARWNARSRARSRARRIGPAWPWVALTAPAVPLMALGLWIALLAMGVVVPIELGEEMEKFLARRGGEAALWVLAVGAAPLLEEFGFRAWIQRPMERRLGPEAAIGVTAVLFSLAHLQMQAVPVRLAAGLVVGHAVYATRSIWTGVALHASWNAGVLLFDAAFPALDPTGKGWRWAAPAAGAALLSLLWCAWTVKRMQDQTRRARPAGRAEARPARSSS